ncbi:MAG: class I SAM-dependent methyltransferase [Anaerolineae bacterium]|nr:class I SAM-dependent methyltransferase [Anaerolineae bacterium]
MYKKYPPSENLATYRAVTNKITDYIVQKAGTTGHLNILEAGCGSVWRFKLQNISYTLTGVDLDEAALNIRKNERKDLDIAIFADLRTVSLEDANYDVIYTENVLEHVDGAEEVLKRFVRWLKPGGTMILIFPNRDSAYSFVTRMTPFAFHVFYKKYIQGYKDAGKPGHDPYPVSFDHVVSRNGIYEFCEEHGLKVKAEYRMDTPMLDNAIGWFLMRTFMWSLSLISFGNLSLDHRNVIFIIEKP